MKCKCSLGCRPWKDGPSDRPEIQRGFQIQFQLELLKMENVFCLLVSKYLLHNTSIIFLRSLLIEFYFFLSIITGCSLPIDRLLINCQCQTKLDNHKDKWLRSKTYPVSQDMADRPEKQRSGEVHLIGIVVNQHNEDILTVRLLVLLVLAVEPRIYTQHLSIISS